MNKRKRGGRAASERASGRGEAGRASEEEREESGTEARGNGASVCSRLKKMGNEREKEGTSERGGRTVSKHVEIRGTLRPDQRHENLVRPPCLRTDHIPSPPDFLVREPYPPGCFAVVHSIRVRVYIDSRIIGPVCINCRNRAVPLEWEAR